MNAKQRYKLAYRVVRLKEYEHAVYEQWDYAHNPTDYEIYQADLSWQVVLDCRRQLAEIQPLVADTREMSAAFSSYNHRHDRVITNRILQIANNFGVAYPKYRVSARHDRDGYIQNWYWTLEKPWMDVAYNVQQRSQLLDRLYKEFGAKKSALGEGAKGGTFAP